MTEVKLLDLTGQLVMGFFISDFLTIPTLILLGERAFILLEPELAQEFGDVLTYTETIPFRIRPGLVH